MCRFHCCGCDCNCCGPTDDTPSTTITQIPPIQNMIRSSD